MIALCGLIGWGIWPDMRRRLSQSLSYFITCEALPCLPLSLTFLFIEPCTEEDRGGEIFIEDPCWSTTKLWLYGCSSHSGMGIRYITAQWPWECPPGLWPWAPEPWECVGWSIGTGPCGGADTTGGWPWPHPRCDSPRARNWGEGPRGEDSLRISQVRFRGGEQTSLLWCVCVWRVCVCVWCVCCMVCLCGVCVCWGGRGSGDNIVTSSEEPAYSGIP